MKLLNSDHSLMHALSPSKSLFKLCARCTLLNDKLSIMLLLLIKLFFGQL